LKEKIFLFFLQVEKVVLTLHSHSGFEITSNQMRLRKICSLKDCGIIYKFSEQQTS